MLPKNDWIVTIDISDAYLAISLNEEFKDYIAFRYQDQTYQFLCMPFGLNDAARAFTKTMKHPVAKVRALGFKVLVYFDDWILATRTRLLCLKQSRFFSKFSPEASLQNKFRKIQSGSISNKRMARLYHRFTEHDNFFTPEKKRQSDRERPGPQQQNESNPERNKSVSGSMQFKQTSSPTGFSAPLFSSEAINSKFKEVPKSLSIRLLSCGYSGHSFNLRSGLVDSGNKVQLFKKNLHSSAKCSHFYRLHRFCRGCHSKSDQNSRLMERKSVGLTHQYKEANGSISCSTAVSSQLSERSRTAVFRQYDGCCLLKSSRRDKISPAFSPSQRDMVMVPGKEHTLVGSSHTRVKKFVCRPSVLSKIPFNGMDPELSSVSSNCGHL